MDALRCVTGAFSWLRIVFTYGGARDGEEGWIGGGGGRRRRRSLADDRGRRTADRVNYDGLIASIQLFILLMSASAALVLATNNSSDAYETANMVVLVMLMIVGMGVIAGFWNYRSTLVAALNDRSMDGHDGGMERRRKKNGRTGGTVGGERGGRTGWERREREARGGRERGGRRRKEEVGDGGEIGEGRERGKGNIDERIEKEVERAEERSGRETEMEGTRREGGGREEKGGGGGSGGRGTGGSSRAVVIGLVVFYLCGSLLDLLHLVAGTDCSLMLLQYCDSAGARLHLAVHFMFHLFRVIYLGVVTLFCLRFCSQNFVDRCLVRYGLVFLQAVNLSLWFDATAHRRPRASRKYWPTLEHQFHCLRPANATNATDCSRSRFYTIVQEDLSPLVRPFMIQFTLLVANFFCQWFFSCVKVTGSGSEQSDGLSDEEVASSTHRMRVDKLLQENDGDGHNGEPEEPNRMEMEEADETSPLMRRVHPDRAVPRSVGFLLWLVAIIVLNSLLIAFSFPVTKTSFLHYGLLVYWILMSLAVGIGFHVSRRFVVRWEAAKEFTGLDYLLLFTSTGPIAYNIFSLIAVTKTGRSTHTYIGRHGMCFSQFFVFFDMAQSYVQVAFSLYAGRVDSLAVARDQARNAAYFRGIVFFLAVSNGALWISNTLNDIALDQNIQKALYGHNIWIVIYNIMKPMSLFFRFNSCLLFIRVFRRRSPTPGMDSAERRTRSS